MLPSREHWLVTVVVLVLLPASGYWAATDCASGEPLNVCCLQVLSMVRGLTAPDLYSATERNLHEFAVNVRPPFP